MNQAGWLFTTLVAGLGQIFTRLKKGKLLPTGVPFYGAFFSAMKAYINGMRLFNVTKEE